MPQEAKMIFCVHSYFNKKVMFIPKSSHNKRFNWLAWISDITSGRSLLQCSDLGSKLLEVMLEMQASQFIILYPNY